MNSTTSSEPGGKFTWIEKGNESLRILFRDSHAHRLPLGHSRQSSGARSGSPGRRTAGLLHASLHLIESGAPGTSLGKLLQVLVVFRMESDLTLLAADDLLSRKLQDVGITETHRRAPKRPRKP